jgi:hypothetical protein
MSSFEMRDGDNSITMEVQLTRRDGTLQPLTGSETGSFIFRTWDGADVLTKALSVSSIPASKVSATLLAADTSALKGQVLRCRVPITFVGGAVETFPTIPDDLLLVVS